MGYDLREKTVSGMIWTFAKHFSLQAFAFIQGIVLARLLAPKDYGLIAMTQIFFSIASVFIDSGFGTALMRKKGRTDLDYSTVFVTNVVMTFFFAVVLFLCAPLIANFYNTEILKDIVRANAILLVLNSFNAVQGVRLRINLQFKVSGFISVVVNVSVGIVTIIFAYLGYGVWSLIYPNFLAPFLYVGLYWYFQRWRPKWKFSWKIWREYFSYGVNLLFASLLRTIYGNLYPLLVGKFYSPTLLGYYSKAHGYAALPVNTFQGVLGQVTFPVLSLIQDEDEAFAMSYRRLVRTAAFIVFPVMLLLAALAEPVIILLITEKWRNSIIYLQLLCFVTMWWPIHILNQDVFKIKGRSDLFLRLEIYKKVLGFTILIITIKFGLIVLCIGQLIHSILCLFINIFVVRNIIKVSWWLQFRDILPSLVLSLFMGVMVYLLKFCFSSLWLWLLFGTFGGLIFYIGVAKLMRSEDLDYVITIFKENVFGKFYDKIKK